MVGWRADRTYLYHSPWLAFAGRFQWARPGASICHPFSWLASFPHVFLGFGTALVVFIPLLLPYRTVAWRHFHISSALEICPLFNPSFFSMVTFTMLSCLILFRHHSPHPSHATFSLWRVSAQCINIISSPPYRHIPSRSHLVH